MLFKYWLFLFIFLTNISCWAQDVKDSDAKAEDAVLKAEDAVLKEEDADAKAEDTDAKPEDADAKTKVLFVNNQDHDVAMYVDRLDENGDHRMVEIGTLAEGATDTIEASIGEEFSFADGGRIRTVRIDNQEENLLMIGPEEFRVRCDTSKGPIHINVIPKWAPHGVSRFLALVKSGYFDGNALLVDQSAARFGIGPDYNLRTEIRDHPLQDDRPIEELTPFRPSYVSFIGGAGSNTRTSEIFIVMPDAPEAELNELGQYPWATPIGFVDYEDLLDVGSKWYSDQEEERDSPDPSRIYEEDGYDYLRKEFPDLSYTGKCVIVPFPAPEEEKDEL